MTTNNDKITRLLQRYLIAVKSDRFEQTGRHYLLAQIEYFTARQQPLRFILPGFPCKSPNDVDKTFSALPDYGEVMAIERLDLLCAELNEIYPPGSELTILSDGTTFADIVYVEGEVKDRYNQALRDLTVTENIVWADLSAILPKHKGDNKTQSDVDIRKTLLSTIGTGLHAFEQFVSQVKSEPEQAAVHDKLCSYLYHDMHLERFSQADRDSYLESVSEKAFAMMYRGRALSHCIAQTYPNHIRLSVHQYDNAGPKFTFALSALSAGSQKALSPWHSVPVRLLDGRFVQLPHAIAKERLLAKVTCQLNETQCNWFYLEVDSAKLTELSYQVVKRPKFGLSVSDPQQLGYADFSTAFLQQLSADFGFVQLKNMELSSQDQLVDFCQPFGQIYQWKFGPVHVVKPEENPGGFVHSIYKTPLHWDLSMLPLSDENVQKNPRFAATTFMLYCKVPPVKGEGQTTLVDSRMALKIAGQQRVKRFKQTWLTYQTKMTYFGGDAHTYPLVFEHPTTGEDIFRYQEGSDLQLQQFLLSCDALTQAELAELIEEVDAIAYDERCLVKHQWQAGDLVIVDNHYTLHGRLAMTDQSMARELWRVQVS